MPDEGERTTYAFLACDAVRSDGRRFVRLRVFCPRTGGTVPVQKCQACEFAVRVSPPDDRDGELECAPPGVEAVPPTAAAITRHGAANVEADVPHHVVGHVMTAGHMRPIAVVDGTGACIGWIRASTYVASMRHRGEIITAGEIMSPAITIDETVPIEIAVRQMATSRLREILVVGPDREPIGLLTDVDALRSVARGRIR